MSGLKAGTVSDFANSMAADMEHAMEQEYQAVKGEGLPSIGAQDRQILFAAIAQGVVRHLKDNLDAWAVQTDTSPTTPCEITNLDTEGTLY